MRYWDITAEEVYQNDFIRNIEAVADELGMTIEQLLNDMFIEYQKQDKPA